MLANTDPRKLAIIDALFFLEAKGLIDFNDALMWGNGDEPIPEDKIKAIVDKFDAQTQAYLYQRLQFKDECGNPLGY